jgi:geranylgeranyl diphosphate synthase, type II
MTNFAKLIDRNLDKFLPPGGKEPKILHKAMRYSVFSGGKRIRPIVLIETAIACGGSPEGAVAAACAVELVHAYSLIHDDLPSMDDDDYRRGKPSCHKKFDEATAILAGDALLTLAFNIIAKRYLPATAAEMVKELSSAVGSEGMTGGQALDIAQDKNAARINRLKTARLFEASAVLGAISARTGRIELAAMRKYGAGLGMAFQAMDDILDGEESLSHEGAKRFITKAKAALKPLGGKSDKLKRIADSVLARNR